MSAKFLLPDFLHVHRVYNVFVIKVPLFFSTNHNISFHLEMQTDVTQQFYKLLSITQIIDFLLHYFDKKANTWKKKKDFKHYENVHLVFKLISAQTAMSSGMLQNSV